jgi:hypothetical protein
VNINSLYVTGGLIGIGNGNIKDCSVEDLVLFSKERLSGGLIGNSGAFIENCQVEGVVTGQNFVGGLAGQSGVRLKSCVANCKVKGVSLVGGLVGSCGGIIENCLATGDVESRGDYQDFGLTVSGVGGLAGYIDKGEISGCVSTVNVSGDGSIVGGLVGRIGNGANTGATIENCLVCSEINHVDLRGDTCVGGLAGWIEADSQVTTSIALCLFRNAEFDSKIAYNHINGIIGHAVQSDYIRDYVKSFMAFINIENSLLAVKYQKSYLLELIGNIVLTKSMSSRSALTNGSDPGFSNPKDWVFAWGSFPCPKALKDNPVAEIAKISSEKVDPLTYQFFIS